MNTALMVIDGPVMIIFLILGLAVIVGIPLAVTILVMRPRGEALSSSSPPPAPTIPGIYQISRMGQVIGAYDNVAIQHLIRSGGIQSNDDYWTQGMAAWQKVGERAEWFPPSA